MATLLSPSSGFNGYSTPGEAFPKSDSVSSNSSKSERMRFFLRHVFESMGTKLHLSKRSGRSNSQSKSSRWKNRNKDRNSGNGLISHNSTQLNVNKNKNKNKKDTHRSRESQVDILDETWEDWLCSYQQGTNNLSTTVRPACFGGFGYSAPPVHIKERQRLRELATVQDQYLWKKQQSWLQNSLKVILKSQRLKFASVSLVERTSQQVLVSVGLSKNLRLISRDISIDAHTILSKDYFCLLDASNDWRTRLSPLVHGPPFLKFYLGVPIVVNGMPVGTIAVFDPYICPQLDTELVSDLQHLSQELVARISVKQTESLSLRNQIEWSDEERDAEIYSAYYNSSFESVSGDTKSAEVDSTSLGSVISTPSSTREREQNQNQGYKIPNNLALSHRIRPLAACTPVRQPFQIFESLLKCKTIKQALTKACRIVSQNLGASLVYIAEYRQHGNNPDLSNSKLVDHYLRKYPEADYNVSDIFNTESEFIKSAVKSEYGIQHTSSEDSERHLKSGIYVPFKRDMPSSTGSFVLVALVENYRAFSPGDVEFTKKVAKALENILTCHEEVTLSSSSGILDI